MNWKLLILFMIVALFFIYLFASRHEDTAVVKPNSEAIKQEESLNYLQQNLALVIIARKAIIRGWTDRNNNLSLEETLNRWDKQAEKMCLMNEKSL